MELVSIKAKNRLEDGVFKAEFADGTSFLFSINYLNNITDFSQWEEGKELSPLEEDSLLFAAACYRAEKIALRLIARAEQSSLALTAKLEKRGTGAGVVRAVISRLTDRELLDDARYAELWVRSRLGNYRGIRPGSKRRALSPLWFLVSLGKRGIDRASSLSAIGKVLDEETEYALLLKYLEETDALEGEGRSYLKTHLKREGFSSGTIERFFETI